ncbi:MAG: hypothetical protein R2911_34600 [Caldilineaceae bacterium]
MNSQFFIRSGGIAAIVSAVLYLLSIGLWMSADPTGAPPALATTAYAASTLCFLVTLYALYVVHSREAGSLALVTTLVLAISMAASLFTDPTDLSNPLILFLTILYGVGALLLAWLAQRSAQMPRGMAILLLVMGLLTLVMLPFMVSGATELVGIMNLVVGIVYVIWLLWLGWRFVQSLLSKSVHMLQIRIALIIAILFLLGNPLSRLPIVHAKALVQSIDGTTIVYITEGARALRLIQPDGSDDRLLWAIPEGVNGEIESVAWRPDAQQIAFVSSHESLCSEWLSDIFLINPDGSDLRRLTNGPACDELAGYAQGSVTVQIENRLNNLNQVLVYVEGAPTAKVVTVAPGATVLVAFPQVADLGDGLPQSVVAIDGYRRWFDAAVQADVAAQSNVHAGTLVLADAGFDAYGASNLSWNPGGTKLAFQFGTGRLWQVATDVPLLQEGGPLLAPAINNQVLGGRPVWSPVDNQVLYQRFGVSPQTITLAEVDGDSAGQALLDVKDTQGLDWLKDGSGLGVAAVDALLSHHDLYLYRFADNSIIQLTQTEPGQSALYPNFAPDNSRLVYIYVPDTQAQPLAPMLRIMNSDGSDDHLLIEGAIRADWSRVQPQNPPPTPEPTAQPTTQPTAQPTTQPTAQPTMQPTASSTPEVTPTAQPTPGATPDPGGAQSYRNYLPTVSR